MSNGEKARKMRLVIDVGNTNIKIGGYVNNNLLFISRIDTKEKYTYEQYASKINEILFKNNYTFKDITEAIISIGVLNAGIGLVDALKKEFGITPLIVNSDLKLNFNIKIPNSKELGADLICGAVAGLEKLNAPLAIYDFGTATTISIIDKDRNFMGGIIIPGIEISKNALINNTSLPHYELSDSIKVINGDTIDAMNAGSIFSGICIVDEMTSRIEEELKMPVKVILTGGLSKLIYDHIKRDVLLYENLTLDGLNRLYEMNTKR